MQRETVNAAQPARRGLTAAEVLVVLVLVLVTLLFLLMLIPRQREVARLAGCRQNLAQIGKAVALYDPNAGTLPAVALGQRGPLAMLLAELPVSDFRSLDPRKPPRGPRSEPVERPVPGFICASDPNALRGLHLAPVSYRATTGDATDGRNGAFAPGRSTRFAAIEAADGTAYTALFSERLVGDGHLGQPAAMDYAVVDGPVAESGCGRPPAGAWQGDAGSSWLRAVWRSTLYTHALPPNAPASCIARDGRTALMGASSGHVEGVNVLFADLSVRTFTSRVEPRIWREWARLAGPPAP